VALIVVPLNVVWACSDEYCGKALKFSSMARKKELTIRDKSQANRLWGLAHPYAFSL
jgi:hypothetical protein